MAVGDADGLGESGAGLVTVVCMVLFGATTGVSQYRPVYSAVHTQVELELPVAIMQVDELLQGLGKQGLATSQLEPTYSGGQVHR